MESRALMGAREPVATDDAGVLDRLAVEAAAGDRASFEAIYQCLVDDLSAYVRVELHDDADAEDVTANTFLRAWRYAGAYRAGTGSYRRWIFGIARNEVRDYRRQTGSRRRVELRDENVAAALEQNGPPASVEIDLLPALRKLTGDQRAVVVLRYFRGKSPREIAEVLGKREGSVRALQHRALAQLRKAVGA